MTRPGKLFAVAVLLMAIAGMPARAATTLLCNGSGSVSDTQITNSQEYSYESHKFEKSSSGSTTVRKPFTGAAQVELSGDTVRMKFPQQLVPPLSDGKDAWYVLSEPFVGDKEITGGVRFNLLNRPKVKIDRVSGQMTVSSGFADFNASCAKVDPDAAPKF
ncbi:hypothetical protein [Uliginosibacterium sp. H1]|uniref:hypothetical protein n=1 Tax=Uliginosibacterium sp. H1 TaxID=3114757 RepID=UPI002E189A3B|nr:hypothetical protein [Uliginosibacterium sp. H1]